MVDNVQLNAGAGGEVCATDDIAGVQYQRVKLTDGTADSTTVVAAGGGVEANALRVTIANDSTGVVSVDDNGSTLSVDDGAGSITVDNAALSVTGGGVEAGALRVTLANDSTGLVSVDDNGGSLTVDNAALSVTGGGVEASALRVTLANDSTGVVSVDDNGGSLTVDGTVSVSGAVDTELTTADLDTGAGTDTRAVVGLVLAASGGGLLVGSANPMPVSDNSGSLTIDNAALSVTGGGVEASALRVTIANDSTGVLSVDDNGSTISVDDGASSLTVDGTVTANAGSGTFAVGGVAAHDAAVSGNPVLNAAEARTTNPTAVANGDVVRIMADDRGSLVVTNEAPRDLVTGNTRLALTSTTETTLVAAVASQFNDLTFLVLSNESATECRVDIRDATAGTVRISVDLAADGGGAVLPFPVPYPQTTANNNWTAQLSAAVSTVYITAVTVARN